MKILFRLGLGLFAALALTNCSTVDPTLGDPSGPDVAAITGSAGEGRAGVPISISAIDDEPRVIGPSPAWRRTLRAGPHRVTVNVVRLLLNASTEIPFDALPARRYEIRARDGGGFYFVDVVDVTDRNKPVAVQSGKFAASGSVMVSSPFIPLSSVRP